MADPRILGVLMRAPSVTQILYEAAKRDVEADPAAFIGPFLSNLKPHQLATVNWLLVEARRVGVSPEGPPDPTPPPAPAEGD